MHAMFERHFTPRTLSELWGFSEDTIVKWFGDEPGVIRQGEVNSRGRRKRVTIRIPESVAQRVYMERSKKK